MSLLPAGGRIRVVSNKGTTDVTHLRKIFLALSLLIALSLGDSANSQGSFGAYYPDDAAVSKSVLGAAKQAVSSITFSVVDPDPTTQILVFDPFDGLFCWSQTFRAGAPVFLQGKAIKGTLEMSCENGSRGTATLTKGPGKRYRVAIDIADGPRFEDYHDF